MKELGNRESRRRKNYGRGLYQFPLIVISMFLTSNFFVSPRILSTIKSSVALGNRLASSTPEELFIGRNSKVDDQRVTFLVTGISLRTSEVMHAVSMFAISSLAH